MHFYNCTGSLPIIDRFDPDFVTYALVPNIFLISFTVVSLDRSGLLKK